MSINQEKIKNIIQKIWSKLPTPKPMSGDDIPSAIDDVHAAGFNNGYEKARSDYTDFGGDWRYLFAYDTRKNIRDRLTNAWGASDIRYLCYASSGMYSLPSGIDFLHIEKMDYAFRGCSSLVEAPIISSRYLNSLSYGFCECSSLVTIPGINLSGVIDEAGFKYAFTDCTSLKNLTILGQIKTTGLKLSTSKSLTVESLMSVINALYDYSESPELMCTLTLGTTNLNKLTDAQIAIATEKGWTLA